jgi:hypothetical protein
MRERITYDHPYKPASTHKLWFWVPFWGAEGSYLEPNHARTYKVQFPVENNMNHLTFALPDPEYILNILKKGTMPELPDLSEDKCHHDVFDKFAQRVRESIDAKAPEDSDDDLDENV